MAQQISMEAAFDGYRKTATDLFHENVLLKARVRELEAQVEQEPAGPVVEQSPTMRPADGQD
ncbi:hypothetical protein [Streptomyces sp. NPDC002994]|uniref:hypothetical protein n=1 Tax=Streptomyces sp. NPDC002994 TaxID=3154441 RepID=UPI0033BE548F